ncbi:hypothetical protein MN608_01482 [Microdochium nivale]|nr:hypothetical protein MN608_01482 [Microdochium nivale]
MHITTSRRPVLATLWLLLTGQVAGQMGWSNPTNATGSVPVPGFRLDRPYPGSWDDAEANSRSWSLNVNVTDTVDFVSLSIWFAPPPAGSPEGAVFSPNSTTNAPPNWIVPQNVTDSWRFVILWFERTGWRTVQDPNDDENGTCPPSVLSAECMLGLRDYIREVPETVYGISMPMPHTGSGTSFNSITDGVKNCSGYTVLSQSLSLSDDFYRGAQQLHSIKKANSGANSYDKVGSRTIPVMLIWAREVNRNVTGDVEFPIIDDDHIKFACVKADTLSQSNSTLPDGSEWLNEESDDGGSGGSGGSTNEPPSAGSALGPASALVWFTGVAAAVVMVV